MSHDTVDMTHKPNGLTLKEAEFAIKAAAFLLQTRTEGGDKASFRFAGGLVAVRLVFNDRAHRRSDQGWWVSFRNAAAYRYDGATFGAGTRGLAVRLDELDGLCPERLVEAFDLTKW